jgi:NhaP-type Na+/H+ or K+/H+ antiporter
MVLFNWLLIGHVIGDFILQTRWMAEKKSSEWLPLLMHSAVYTAAVTTLALLAKGLSIWGILIVFVSHVLLDQRKFVYLWAEKVTGTENSDWLKIALDQSWHIVILGLVTLF